MNYYTILLKQPSNVLIVLYKSVSDKNTYFARYLKNILTKRNVEII